MSVWDVSSCGIPPLIHRKDIPAGVYIEEFPRPEEGKDR